MCICSDRIAAAGVSAVTSGPRARDLGVPFVGMPGPLDAITGVGGVEVGYATLISGADRDNPSEPTSAATCYRRGKRSDDRVGKA